ncbi:Hypothetical predicted protein [Cloeon dipterum]|uniref:Cyclin-like domain-containing protein n=1 Tax=Cloeon dipterum TaxID=197152 RepID=A0A8S1BWI0_9INSE|nr:Hypothetical predicted protein [Cloeon dipterum]
MGSIDNLMMRHCNFEWTEEYELEFFVSLIAQEKQRKGNYMLSPQKEYRNELVLWMKSVCKEFSFNLLTLHLACYILDSFMDEHEIRPFRLRLVATAALSIAAKFEEKTSDVPTFNEMFIIENPHNMEQAISKDVIFQIELRVFRYLDWNLHVPTVAHFVYFFLVTGLTEADFNQRPEFTENELRLALRDHLQEMLDHMLLDLWSLKVSPSWMASVCFIKARHHLGLHPVWPLKFEQLTKLSIINLQPAFKIAQRYDKLLVYQHEESSPNDSGYRSAFSTPDSLPPQEASGPACLTSVRMQFCPMSQEQSPSVTARSSEDSDDCGRRELFDDCEMK